MKCEHTKTEKEGKNYKCKDCKEIIPWYVLENSNFTAIGYTFKHI